MAAVSAVKPGIKCVAYRNTGTYGSPTWTALNLVSDANVGKGWEFGPADVRATRVKLYAPSQMDMNPTITMRCDDLDTGYKAISAASVSAAVIDMLLLDGPIATEGTEGIRAHFHISDTGQDQGKSVGTVYKNFELKPGLSSEGYPQNVIMGATSTLNMTAPG